MVYRCKTQYPRKHYPQEESLQEPTLCLQYMYIKHISHALHQQKKQAIVMGWQCTIYKTSPTYFQEDWIYQPNSTLTHLCSSSYFHSSSSQEENCKSIIHRTSHFYLSAFIFQTVIIFQAWEGEIDTDWICDVWLGCDIIWVECNVTVWSNMYAMEKSCVTCSCMQLLYSLHWKAYICGFCHVFDILNPAC